MFAATPVNDLNLPATLTWHPAPQDGGQAAECRRCATLRDGVLCWATLPAHVRWRASMQRERGDRLSFGEIVQLLDWLLAEG